MGARRRDRAAAATAGGRTARLPRRSSHLRTCRPRFPRQLGADGASATSTTTAQASSNRTPRWPPRRRDRGVPLHGKDAEKPWADTTTSLSVSERRSPLALPRARGVALDLGAPMLDAHPGATPAATADRLSTKASGRRCDRAQAVEEEARPGRCRPPTASATSSAGPRRPAGRWAAVAARSWVG